MACEIHLRDGTILDAETYEVIRTPEEADTEMKDYRLTAARNFLATAPETDFSRLLADVLDVAEDYIATDLDETATKVTIEGGVHLSPGDVLRLCDECKLQLLLDG